MTQKELNLAIFEGRADRPLWQPRLEEWIRYNRERDTVPARFREMDELEIYDALGCSPRYAASTGLQQYLEEGTVETWEEEAGNDCILVHRRTVSGQITAVDQVARDNGRIVNRRIRRFSVQSIADLQVVTDVVNAQRFRADITAFQAAATRVGHRAEPTVFFGGSGFTELIKEWCGLEGTYYLLADHRTAVEEHLEACDRRDDRIMEAALQLPCRIFNFGDHATNEFTPPPILKRYMLPRWQRLSKVMAEHGRFVHTHWDGNSRHMLPFLQETGVHGVEALTPLPMCDMTLEEIKTAVGDNIVVLDLIPATHFLAHYSTQECLDFAKRIMGMFVPRLILGVSDEISGVGNIRRIEAITELVDELYGLPE